MEKFIKYNRRKFSVLAVFLIICAVVSTSFGQNGATAEKSLTEGNLTEAVESATQAINSNRGKAIDYAVRGLLLFILKNDSANALNDLKKAVQLEPDNGVVVSFLANVETDNALSKQAAEKALGILDSPQTGLEYYAKAGALLLSGRSGEMLDELDGAIELSPRFSLAYNRRGTYFKDKKDYDSAISNYSKAVEFSPNYAYAYGNRADLYFIKKDYSAAVEDYTKVLEIFPDDPGYRLGRGAAYYNSKQPNEGYADYVKAVELYSRNIERNPQDANALLNRGISYSNLRDYVRAAADYSTYIGLFSKDAFAYYKRAEAYESLGKIDLGKADRRKYTELGGTEPTPTNIGENIYPEAVFDVETAKSILARGNSTIRGVACTGGTAGTYKSANVTVSLFPVTSYFDQ